MARSVTRLATVVPALVVSALLLSCPFPAAAQAPGVRGGVSVDPDQFYLGGHYETGPLVDHLHFKPNLEVGFGDDVTLVAVNFEFVYKFPRKGPWNLYAGGGPAINFYSFDDRDDGESEPGLNLIVGAEAASGLFFEIKFGTLDSPDLKFGVGWSFR